MKQTVGSLVIDNWGKSEAPECREVTREAWWKTFQPRLKKELETYKGNKDKIYIMLSIKNEGLLGSHVKHATWIIFEELPPPKTSSILWSFKRSNEELKIEWCLPDKDSINEIVDMPDSYDKKLVEDCIKFKKAKRIAVPIDPKKRPKTKVVSSS